MKYAIKKMLLLIAMVFTLFPLSAYDFQVDGIYYSVTSLENLTCKVVAGDKKYEGDINIPSDVTYNNRKLTVSSIGAEAFYGSDVQSVVIGSSVRSIGERAFYNCAHLTSLLMPNSVTSIGEAAFERCISLKSLMLSKSLGKIERRTFYACLALESVSLENSITCIGDHAFCACSSLKSVSIPNSVTTIEYNCFRECSSLKSVVISNSVTSIGNSAFAECISLESVIIPNSVTTIGEWCFGNCHSLESIIIPNSATDIKRFAFKDCNSLVDIQLSTSLKYINPGLFYGCEKLESIKIPGSVEFIYQRTSRSYGSYYTFENCNNLQNLYLLDGDKYLAVGYDGYDSEGTIYDWGEWTETIKYLYLDRICQPIYVPNIEELELGEHIEIVNIKDMDQLKNLVRIKCRGVVPPELPDLSNKQYMDLEVVVPDEALDVYKNTGNWKNFWNIISKSEFETGTAPIQKNNIIEEERVNLLGHKVDSSFGGIVIVRYSDGSTKKIIQK